MPCSCAASSASAICRDGQRFVGGDRSACEALREVLAVDELHDQRANAVTLLEAVDLGDGRMVERRKRVRFASEPHQSVGIRGKRGGQNLDGDVAVQAGIAGPEHFAHAARADSGNDLVRPDTHSPTERHGRIVPRLKLRRPNA
jgi:hypothetical protein